MDCTYDEREGDPASLDWPTRLAIAMDVARGLSHMHNDPCWSTDGAPSAMVIAS